MQKSRFLEPRLYGAQDCFFPARCCRSQDVVSLGFAASPFSAGKPNGVRSSWFEKTDQELTPEDFKLSHCNGF